ncbi:hypothetical protein [Nannocystis radixulma]|uniref:Outer membrane protein beta-barrel domain-containing protein n=1 Tax=Nannocystis radixulma TaxID=2995305 RepID=A0ABT5BH83_9BACT|nr:hypothetical protein [Nannocystis radixulma]MDC0673517.1 hypothetical protein [Nannocystis radixulma]
MRRTVVLTALVALALPVQAARAKSDDQRPFRRGTILPSVALGGSFSRNYGGSLLVGAGASYFVVGGLAVGLHLRNVSTFYSQAYKESVGPTLFAQIPTNEFSLTPSLLWVIYRGERVAPYVSFGLGPVFLNKKRGVLGQWTIGPGVMIRLGGLAWLDLGVGISMRFTNDRCQRAYTFVEGDYSYYPDYACSFTWGFRGGIVFGIGGRRQAQPPSRPSPPPSYESQPASSYPPPQSYPPPAQPVPSASPPPATTPPVGTPPETPPTPASPPPAPVESPSPANPPAPSTPPPTTAPTETSPVPPPGENLPVPPPA